MITRTEEVWIAEGNFPDCKSIWIEKTKEELGISLKKDMEKHLKAYLLTDDQRMKNYIWACLKEISSIYKEWNELPAN